MKKVTIGLFVLALSLSGCAVAFRVAEAGAAVPAAIVYPLAVRIGRPCQGSSVAWDGTAGSPCRSMLISSEIDDASRWVTSVPETCKTDLRPAVTFAAHCSRCHDTGRAPDLAVSTTVAWATRGDLSSLLHDGRPEHGMPSFASRLTSCQIDALTKYVKGR